MFEISVLQISDISLRTQRERSFDCCCGYLIVKVNKMQIQQWHDQHPQNLKFHVTAGKIGNSETCNASTFKVPL